MSTHTRIGNYDYTIQDDGTVACKGYGDLGHLEDCEEIANNLQQLFDQLDNSLLN